MYHTLTLDVRRLPPLAAPAPLALLWGRIRLFFADLTHTLGGADVSDETLMAAYLAGDHEAFRRLFDRFAPAIHRAARRRGFCVSDANDAVQQTFVHVHQSRRDFRKGSSVRPWLYTIAFNVMRDLGRRFQSQSRLKENFSNEAQTVEEPEAPPTPETAGSALGGALQAAMGRLSKAQREVLELHYFEEMSFKDIATTLGSREGAVRVKAHRGYERLRAMLGVNRAERGTA